VRVRSESTEAIVLRSVDFGDSDRIVTLLTTKYGKLTAIARGARKSTRRFHALSAFCVLRVDVSLGSGELGTLSGAELSRPFLGILADLDKLTVAGAACELVREALPMRQPEPAVFTTLVSLLSAVDVAKDRLHQLLLGFSWRVMTLVGFEPGLDACGTCGKQPRPTQAGAFDPVLGALSCRACGGGATRGRTVKLAGSTLVSMRRSLGAEWFSAFDDTAPSELRRVRAVTADFIEQRLERRLHGATLLMQVDSDPES